MCPKVHPSYGTQLQWYKYDGIRNYTILKFGYFIFINFLLVSNEIHFKILIMIILFGFFRPYSMKIQWSIHTKWICDCLNLNL